MIKSTWAAAYDYHTHSARLNSVLILDLNLDTYLYSMGWSIIKWSLIYSDLSDKAFMTFSLYHRVSHIYMTNNWCTEISRYSSTSYIKLVMYITNKPNDIVIHVPHLVATNDTKDHLKAFKVKICNLPSYCQLADIGLKCCVQYLTSLNPYLTYSTCLWNWCREIWWCLMPHYKIFFSGCKYSFDVQWKH